VERTTPEDATLHPLFEAGQRAFPGLVLAPEAFVRHVAARFPAGEPPPRERAPDLYLACACALGIPGALDAFDRAHLRVVAAYLARMRPSAAFVDDVRQSLREKLFVGRGGNRPKIVEYDGRGALASWVRVIAVRAAIDLRRAGHDAAEDPSGCAEGPSPIDVEAGYLKERYREAFNAALRGATLVLSSDQRELLRRHFVDGVTLDRIAADAGVHRATIARRIAAAREAVAAEAWRLLSAALGASDSELESLAGVVRSQIDVSLAGLLGLEQGRS